MITSEGQALIQKVASYLPADKVALIDDAFIFADACHDGQRRMSGEPYISHPLQAAFFLADLNLDTHTIIAALLHDVIEDCGVTFDDLEKKFGLEVAKLVDGVTKLTRMDYRIADGGKDNYTAARRESDLYSESLRKMLVAMAEDIRVVLIKLADRLHNMETLDALSPEKRSRIAQETLDIYSPLAHRLGIWEIKWRLDDLAFKHLNLPKFLEITEMLTTGRDEREEYVEAICQRLREELEQFNIEGDVSGRPKSIYSIHQKTQKYEDQGKEVGDIYDLYALRVLVGTTEDCYKSLGVIHQSWSPIPGQFDDYIANPKENLYQALHTTVICDGGTPLEIQIKTNDMHQISEYGVAAHWRYKEGRPNDQRFEEKMTWLRQLLEWQRESTVTDDFMESVREDIFHDQVFVYTPKGAIVELSAGSTPIDFAYKNHTELGHKCSGGKINGRLVSLDTPLQNGDTVEILTAKSSRGPSPDWLNANLGYVKSAGARQSIRQWFHRQARGSNINRGKDILKKELRQLSLKLADEEILHLVKYSNMDEFLASLGSGGITANQVAYRLSQPTNEPVPYKPPIPLSSPSSGVSVLGVGDLLTRIAQCCNPIPGDLIRGFVTRTQGVTVHKQGCSNLINEDEPERLISVSWGEKRELYPVRIKMEAYDRVGLLRDITMKVSEEKVNIASVVTTENMDGTVAVELTVHTTGLDQLGKLFDKLEGVKSVTSASRVHSLGAPTTRH